MHRVINAKFPDKAHALEAFLYRLLRIVTCVKTPEKEANAESQIRDIKDRPILRAALFAGVDILITGDRDLLESGLANPHIIKPAQFMQDG